MLLGCSGGRSREAGQLVVRRRGQLGRLLRGVQPGGGRGERHGRQQQADGDHAVLGTVLHGCRASTAIRCQGVYL